MSNICKIVFYAREVKLSANVRSFVNRRLSSTKTCVMNCEGQLIIRKIFQINEKFEISH